MSFSLGIDLSTQSVTGYILDISNGTYVTHASTSLPTTCPPVSEHHPDSWWEALVKVLQTLKRTNIALNLIESIGVAAQCHGLVILDKTGRPIRSAILWNDTRSYSYARNLVKHFGKDWWAKSIGIVPNAAHTISKLLFLKASEPDSYRKISYILQPHDYINFCLTGKYFTDRSEASGTGYFKNREGEYDFELLTTLFGTDKQWEKVLSPVLGPDQRGGVLRPEAAQQLHLRPGIPVTVGGGDQHLGAVGLGVQPGDITFSLGTSGVVFGNDSVPLEKPNPSIDAVCNATDGWLPLICTLNCTKVTNLAAQLLDLSVEELDNFAFDNYHVCHSFSVPFIDGERFPALPQASGQLLGIRSDTTRSDIALSAFIGVAFGLYSAYNVLLDAGVKNDGRIRVIGGGGRSRTYRQMLADLLRQPIEIVNVVEVTARGAALQAAAALQEETVETLSIQWAPSSAALIEPSQNDWSSVYENYQSVVTSLITKHDTQDTRE